VNHEADNPSVNIELRGNKLRQPDEFPASIIAATSSVNDLKKNVSLTDFQFSSLQNRSHRKIFVMKTEELVPMKALRKTTPCPISCKRRG